MADAFTTAGSIGPKGSETTDEETPQQPPKHAGQGKQFNTFSGQEEDVPPLNLSLSPADQRIAAAPPHTDPLPELIDRAVNERGGEGGVDVESHVGPSMQEDPIPGETPLPVTPEHETPNTVLNPDIPTQGIDAAPANDVLVDDEGAEIQQDGNPEGVPIYVGQDTQAYNDSLNERKEAEQDAQVSNDELPEIEPPVPGTPLDQPDEEDEEDALPVSTTGNDGTSKDASQDS